MTIMMMMATTMIIPAYHWKVHSLYFCHKKKNGTHYTHFFWTKLQRKKHFQLINLMGRTFNDGLRSFYYTLCTIPSITNDKKSNLIVQTPPLTVNHNPNTHGHFNYFSYSPLYLMWETRARQCVYVQRKRWKAVLIWRRDNEEVNQYFFLWNSSSFWQNMPIKLASTIEIRVPQGCVTNGLIGSL